MHALVTIRYFAMMREARGLHEESVELRPGETASELYLRVASRYGFSLRPEDIRFAVNDRFVNRDRELSLGDVVVFIPPVAGG